MAAAEGVSGRTQAQLEDFVARLKRRRVEGSLDTAKKTAVLMRQVVADSRTLSPAELLAAVRAAGVRLTEACRTGAWHMLRGKRATPAPSSLQHCAPEHRVAALCSSAARADARPRCSELSIGNIVRRVLHLIREETAAVEAAGDDAGGEATDEPASRAAARVPSLATLLEVHETASPGARGRGAASWSVC